MFMRTWKLAAAAAAFFAIAGAAQAGDYWAISLADQGIMLADASDVQSTSAGYKSVATYAILKTPAGSGSSTVDYIKGREEYDCAGKRSRTLLADAYSMNGSKIMAVFEQPGEWSFPDKNQATQQGLKLLCDSARGIDAEAHFGDHAIPVMVQAYRNTASK
jgi:hypothetical protein